MFLNEINSINVHFCTTRGNMIKLKIIKSSIFYACGVIRLDFYKPGYAEMTVYSI